MNKIKDFFYDRTDIMVALMILLIAAFIIYTRIDNIMDYPETLVNATVTEQGTISEPASSESTAAESTAPTSGSTAATTAPTETQPATTAPTSTTTAPTQQ